MSYFNNPLLIGSDIIMKRLADLADVGTKALNYPPYNIKKTDENKYVIEMAVAGFSKSDIEVEFEDDKLIIRGNTSNTEEEPGIWPKFLHKGIAERSFIKSFNLTENVEIQSANLVNGILKVALEAIIPEHKKPTKIEINDGDEND